MVVNFLKKLSKKEMTGLGFFVQNPCFNPNKDVVQLFNYLDSFAPCFSDVKLTAENAFNAIFPGKIFDRAALNGLMNKLLAVIKKFINALQKTTNRMSVEFGTLIFYNRRYPKRFQSQLKKVRNLIEKNEKGGMRYRYLSYVEYQLSRYLAINEKSRNYVTLSDAMDKYYWLSKLPLFAEMLNYKLITADNGWDISQLDIHLKFIEEVGYIEDPLINLWYSLIGIFKNMLDKVPVALEDYYRFKTLFFENIDELHDNEKRNLYIYLRNIIRLSSFEDADYYEEEFEIDQVGLEQELIFLNGFLRELSVKNIINSAIKMGEIQWAKDFLEQYKDVFWKKFADDLLAYCKAVINFYEGKYDEALALFATVQFNNVFFEIERRIKLIQIYYEIEDVELFGNQLNSLTTYISRNQDKVGEPYAQSYLGFAKYVRKISHIIRGDLDEITKLEKKISKIPVRLLFEKKWLLDKLNELKGKR